MIDTSGDVYYHYRLVVTATDEWYCHFDPECGNGGASAFPGHLAIATTINRVNEIYQSEVCIQFDIFGIYSWYPGVQDPFPDNATIDGALLDQNQSLVDAGYGSVGVRHRAPHERRRWWRTCPDAGGVHFGRARGGTSLIDPVGDPWAVDYVAHEIGHRLGARHTFAGTNGSCSGNAFAGNRVEPGSGSTIMGYAGICGVDNIQPHSSPYFHARSLEQIVAVRNIAGNCADDFPSGNTPPVANAGPDGFIPVGTPFYLAGAGTDADNDALTYCWEQADDNTPLFRSLSPTGSPARYLPDLDQVLAGSSDPWEILPTAQRNFNFRLTVRDNRNRGGIDDDDIVVDAVGAVFSVTSPNGGEHLGSCEPVNVTWSIGGSDLIAPNVRIFLRDTTTGAFSFVALTANDGSETLNLPEDLTTGYYRLWIEGDSGNSLGAHFYDVSNADILVSGGLANYVPYVPTGWADAIVPRAVPDASVGSVALPTGLTGEGVAFVSWCYGNSALVYGCGAFENVAHVDDRVLASATQAPGPEQTWLFLNYGIGVKGGRHTVWQVSDPLDQVRESDEGDNGYARQWVWSPWPVVAAPVATPPPVFDAGHEWIPAGTIAYDNVDGSRIAASGADWVVVAVNAADAGADYDLALYPPSTGVESGFAVPLLTSSAGAGAVDAILFNTRQAGIPTFDVGVSNRNGAAAGYWLEQRANAAEIGVGDVRFSETVGGDQMVWVGEFYAAPDRLGDIVIEVLNASTGQPLTLGFFDAQFSHGSIYGATAVTPVVDGRASLPRTITASGHYGIVLMRNAAEGQGDFTFDWKIRDANQTVPVSEYDAGLPQCSPSAARPWGDYDGDGDLDVLVTGATGSRPGDGHSTATTAARSSTAAPGSWPATAGMSPGATTTTTATWTCWSPARSRPGMSPPPRSIATTAAAASAMRTPDWKASGSPRRSGATTTMTATWTSWSRGRAQAGSRRRACTGTIPASSRWSRPGCRPPTASSPGATTMATATSTSC